MKIWQFSILQAQKIQAVVFWVAQLHKKNVLLDHQHYIIVSMAMKCINKIGTILREVFTVMEWFSLHVFLFSVMMLNLTIYYQNHIQLVLSLLLHRMLVMPGIKVVQKNKLKMPFTEKLKKLLRSLKVIQLQSLYWVPGAQVFFNATSKLCFKLFCIILSFLNMLVHSKKLPLVL